ncbi:hypothetical protein SAMN00790413_04223 [Deinococcus hopiensis KR-140]|uniref:Uncharacterized protein n=1 Tax=Deinococcus hopiensis KR-140 TaxID=695939 RepID=A0A1W1UPS1_9DEIO|nr:hypothetical protein SAMN00790413_04223 [Deinococcus hopiensis KR-140]
MWFYSLVRGAVQEEKSLPVNLRFLEEGKWYMQFENGSTYRIQQSGGRLQRERIRYGTKVIPICC